MIWLDMAAVFGFSLLAGLGVGGGGLFVIYLTLVSGMGQLEAQGLNLLLYLTASAASLPVHLKKRSLSLPSLAILIAAGAIGSLLGSLCASRFDPALLRRLFGGMLILSGTAVLLSRRSKENADPGQK